MSDEARRSPGELVRAFRSRISGWLTADRFDRFSEGAREALSISESEARSLRHGYIGTEHMLLALSVVTDSVAGRTLGELGVDYEKVRERLLNAVPVGEAPPEGPIGLTPRAKRAIELAVEEATRLKHQYVGTEHLLLGLAGLKEGVAFDALVALGVSPSQIEATVLRILASPSPAPAARSNVVACRVDDRALAAIEALVEAGIRQTRSDAAAWLIQAGIEANADLFEKVHSTAREIQRLREEMNAAAQQLATRGPRTKSG